ncbi:MAG: 3-dehydroquinate synthase [Oscillospiraceae bacterium]
MKTITVNASRTYNVIISAGILREAGEYSRKTIGGKTAAIVTDDIVDGLYGKVLEASLTVSGYRVVKFIIKNGEMSKNAENYIALLNFLAGEHLTRTDAVFALGGGVVGDLAGFAAATYLRGVRLVQIPTTLLSAVDSSVGGKTAINLDAGKNLAGAFYQPDLVLCDYDLLATLPQDVLRDGFAEVIKYGIIADAELFEILKMRVNAKYEEILARCVKIKRDVVCADERDTGERQLLNFGHTVGHAIEVCSHYGIPHGSAVAAGMAIVARASACAGICLPDCSNEIIEMLRRYSLPDCTSYKPEILFGAMLSDKKRDGDSLTIVVPEKIGRCVLRKIPVGRLMELISLGLKTGAEG